MKLRTKQVQIGSVVDSMSVRAHSIQCKTTGPTSHIIRTLSIHVPCISVLPHTHAAVIRSRNPIAASSKEVKVPEPFRAPTRPPPTIAIASPKETQCSGENAFAYILYAVANALCCSKKCCCVPPTPFAMHAKHWLWSCKKGRGVFFSHFDPVREMFVVKKGRERESMLGHCSYVERP